MWRGRWCFSLMVPWREVCLGAAEGSVPVLSCTMPDVLLSAFHDARHEPHPRVQAGGQQPLTWKLSAAI